MTNEPLDVIYRELQQGLLNWLQLRVNNLAVAEDLLQSIFLKALQAYQRGDEVSNPSAWIYQIARNTLVDYYRQKKASSPVSDDLLTDDSSFVDKSLTACLQPLIRQLPDKYQQALLAVDLQEESMQSLAEQEQVSLSAIKSRVSRGRQLLKQQLLACCQIQYSSQGEIEDYLPKRPDCSC